MIELTTWLIGRYDLGIEDVIRHYDVTGKECPKYYVDHPDAWEQMKADYDYRCACCGSREGEPHRYWKNTLTKLQKGHKDPRRPLGPGNIIPQCSKCNQPDRNCWVYDDKGRVVGLANAIVVERCPADLQKEIYIRLYRQFGGKDPKDL